MTRELTGKHVLAIVLTAFGIIIAVNITMAVFAIGTFPGLEVKNSYVASQSFDRDRAAQVALGWVVTPEYDGKVLTLAVRDAQGNPAKVAQLSATIGRPTISRDDVTPEFTYRGGLFSAAVALEPGNWVIRLTAVAADGTEFRQRIDHYTGSHVN